MPKAQKISTRLSVALLFTSVALVTLAFILPVSTPDTHTYMIKPRPPADANKAQSLPNSQLYSEVELERRLRKPLFDPPPQEAPEKVKPDRPNLRLVATVLGKEGTAMFTNESGDYLYSRVGDSIGGENAAVVVEIARNHVLLRHNDLTYKTLIKGN